LADRKACAYLVDLISQRIKEYGVDVYREDYNIDPLGFWQVNDTQDRQGITEMKYIEGLYQFWSGLLQRNPDITIDNCASGGRRIDIETCSLSYPMWKTDRNDVGDGLQGPGHWPDMSLIEQVMGTGLSLYIPFYSGVTWGMDPYNFRSAMTSGMVLAGDILEIPKNLCLQGVAELQELRPLFQGDIYPLLPLTPNPKDWYAYQMDRPDLSEGCMFVFRRHESSILMCEIILHNIDPEALYQVSITRETYDQGPWVKMTGRELIQPEIKIKEKPGSALLRYKLIQN
jgi:alpha-galactosidase